MTIDWWTLGLQTVNVIVLVWLLKRFFWRPLAGMIEQRRVTTQTVLEAAEGKRSEAAAALAEIEKTRAGFAQERDAILAAAKQAGEQAQAARLAETDKQIAALQASAATAIEKEKAEADKAWAERASHLAVDIAKRLAARLDGPAVRATFLDWLLQKVRAMPDSARHAASADGMALDAVSATPLDVAEQERYRGLLAEALGFHPQIAFKVDDTLIAGLELRGVHFAVSNSWRADLTQILTDITHDTRR